MKAHQFSGILWVSVLALAGSMNTATAWDIPQNSYACHVTTTTSFPAVVLVQAKDSAEAVAVAKRNPAKTFDGTVAQTGDVVECILPPDEKFSNATFQQNFDKMDR